MLLPCEDNILRLDVLERDPSIFTLQCDVEHMVANILKTEIYLFRYIYGILQ